MSVQQQRYERRVTQQILVGKVPVGGGAPVSVQSMTTTKTADVDGTLAQIYALAAAGCDIVRCTCNEEPAAERRRNPFPVQARARGDGSRRARAPPQPRQHP